MIQLVDDCSFVYSKLNVEQTFTAHWYFSFYFNQKFCGYGIYSLNI